MTLNPGSVTSPLTLLVLGSSALMGAALWLYAADRRVRAQAARRSAVLAPYARAEGVVGDPEQSRLARVTPKKPSGLLGRCRIERERPDLYPLPWWVLACATSTAAAIATGILVFFAGPEFWAALPIAWFVLTRSLFGHFSQRRTATLYAQLPDAMAMIVRSVRAGLPVPEALRVVAEEGQWPTSVEFQSLHDETKLGAMLPECLMRLADRCALLEYRFFAVALALQSQSGGSLAETLENLADVVRKRIALRQRAIALSSEARMTMYVLAALPFIAALALLAVGPDYIALLIDNRVGRMILLGGIVLLCLGITSMRIIIKKAVA